MISSPHDSSLSPEQGWHQPESIRIAPLDTKNAKLSARGFIWLVNRIGNIEASNLFLMLLKNFRLFRVWLAFAAKMMPYGQIKREDTELVILRVAWNCRCKYEWAQHVDIGMRVGLTSETIQRITQGPDVPGWVTREAALLRACDELHANCMISRTTWQQLEQHFEERLLLEVLMLIGHYEMLAGVLNSSGLPLDDHLQQSTGTKA